MKEKIRKIVLQTTETIFTSPKEFAGWILQIRQQENLLTENTEHSYSKEFIEEIFWQIVCLRYLQTLKLSQTDQNFDYTENLIKKYRGLNSIEALFPLSVEKNNLLTSAWSVSKEVDEIVNRSYDFVEKNKDMENLFYHLRHWSGHGVRPELRRFASNLRNDLKQ